MTSTTTKKPVYKAPKPVFRITEHGEIINQYPSMRRASELTGTDGKDIWLCCAKKRSFIDGYTWRYVSELIS